MRLLEILEGRAEQLRKEGNQAQGDALDDYRAQIRACLNANGMLSGQNLAEVLESLAVYARAAADTEKMVREQFHK